MGPAVGMGLLGRELGGLKQRGQGMGVRSFAAGNSPWGRCSQAKLDAPCEIEL